jgi:hypothetical protein
MKKKKIIFIVCFFGKHPWYFKFFLRSAACNATVDFLWVTDNVDSVTIPSNFSVLKMSLKDLETIARNKLNCNVSINFPYKICDIRPAYGVIFEEYLRDYDFWGYCDADVIFGNIRGFLNNRLLNKYDIISARPDFLPGYFVVYRNAEAINQFFTRSADYISSFENPEYTNFDECSFNHEYLFEGKQTKDLHYATESMTYLLKEKCVNCGVNVLFDLMAIDFATGKMYWNNGTLMYDNKFEVLLYHLIEYKRNPQALVPEWKSIPDRFYINPDNFSLAELSDDTLIK